VAVSSVFYCLCWIFACVVAPTCCGDVNVAKALPLRTDFFMIALLHLTLSVMQQIWGNEGRNDRWDRVDV
jgi:hypothetical protein